MSERERERDGLFPPNALNAAKCLLLPTCATSEEPSQPARLNWLNSFDWHVPKLSQAKVVACDDLVKNITLFKQNLHPRKVVRSPF